MSDRRELLIACGLAYDALLDLSDHPAFADDAPEFNKGGVGYEACTVLRKVLKED